MPVFGSVLSASSVVSPNDSALAMFDELDDFGDFLRLRQFLLHRFDCLAPVVFGAKNQAKSFLDQFHAFGRKIFAFQTDQIDPTNFGWVAIGDHEWWNVLHNFRTATCDRKPPNSTKLMHRCEPAHHRMGSNLDVAAQCAVVGKNDVIAHGAIVSDVTVGEKISVIADSRFAFAGGAAVCCYEFAERVFVADFKVSRLAAIF